MEIIKGKSAYFFCIKASTWYKDSHSLYDYQSTKLHSAVFSFPLNTSAVTVYRKRAGTQVIAVQSHEEAKIPIEQFQILSRFQIQHLANFKLKLHVSNEKIKVKPITSDRLNTNQSIDSAPQKQQQAYIIVRKIKDLNGEPKGFKIQPGNTIKIGRVQFFVSEVRIDGVTKIANLKNNQKTYASRNLMVYNPNDKKQVEKNACKICLQDLQDKQNFLFNPCLCSGSCGTVHLECLMQWIHFKVKKQVVGGTLHYNFQKFSCQVCKQQLPMIIDIQGVKKELLPIQKPESNYLILEGACQKTKSVVLIQNIPSQGIKLGRGHECQIRITDISVSRNHAAIKSMNNSFYIFDNKSKFGTLVKPEKLVMDLSRVTQGLQIGRTTISLDLKKEKQQIKQIKQVK